MNLLHPALLLLSVPLAWVWWTTRSGERVTDGLRALIGFLLLLAICGPYRPTSTAGRDLVVVVDRSRSMPGGTREEALELIRLAEEERGAGDRVSVIAFGKGPRIERLPSDKEKFQTFERELDADGSDLARALETALELIPEQREGAILLVSDGEESGADPIAVARRAFGRGVRIDVRGKVRPAAGDISVDRLDLPGEVAVGEAFQFNVWVRSDRRVESDFVLKRGDQVLSSGRRVFEVGMNRLVFRDVGQRAGVFEYRVELGGVEGDRVRENDRGLGGLRVGGAPAVLLLNQDGQRDSLALALGKAGIPIEVRTPESARLDSVGLASFRAVILENLPYERIATHAPALVNFVREHGGGLLVTGGHASFGVGGYHLSKIDELLPVSMELRQEHRKLSVAMAIALDRSGSMAAPVAGNQSKMDLANLGTAAAIELLSPMDSVAVIAVDSAPHTVQELTRVIDREALTRRVRSITAGGGGIFVYTALLAAGKELEKAEQLNKHILLFSDAADSEEQERCPALIAELSRMGVTLSVIALGTEHDSDAEFLKRISGLGGGEIYFTMDPTELPRLFALDTMTAARSTFVDEPTAVATLPDLFGLGAQPGTEFPSIGGYNLTYMRPGAVAGMVTQDEYKAPVFAFQHEGLGRTAVYTGQVGGEYGSEIIAWKGFAEFFVTATRWLVGNEAPDEFFTTVRRAGSEAVVTVEMDADAALPPDTSTLVARVETPDGTMRELTLQRTGEALFEARTSLDQEGIVLGTVALGEDRFVHLPPVALPYSPEFERRADPEHGRRLLRRIARESGGNVGTTVGEFFRGERESRVWRMIARELVLVALILLLFEIAGRRLSLWGSLRTPGFLREAYAAGVGKVERWRAGVRQKRAPRRGVASSPVGEPDIADVEARGAGSESMPPGAQANQPRESPDLGSALARARRSADRKLER